MSRVDLPRASELYIDGVLELVDENGRRMSPQIIPYPDDTVRGAIRLEPNEEMTEAVSLRQIFGVSRLDGYAASLTVMYFYCDSSSRADNGDVRVHDIKFVQAN